MKRYTHQDFSPVFPRGAGSTIVCPACVEFRKPRPSKHLILNQDGPPVWCMQSCATNYFNSYGEFVRFVAERLNVDPTGDGDYAPIGADYRPPDPTDDRPEPSEDVERIWAAATPAYHEDAEPLRKYLANRGWNPDGRVPISMILARFVPLDLWKKTLPKRSGVKDYDSGRWENYGSEVAGALLWGEVVNADVGRTQNVRRINFEMISADGRHRGQVERPKGGRYLRGRQHIGNMSNHHPFQIFDGTKPIEVACVAEGPMDVLMMKQWMPAADIALAPVSAVFKNLILPPEWEAYFFCDPGSEEATMEGVRFHRKRGGVAHLCHVPQEWDGMRDEWRDLRDALAADPTNPDLMKACERDIADYLWDVGKDFHPSEFVAAEAPAKQKKKEDKKHVVAQHYLATTKFSKMRSADFHQAALGVGLELRYNELAQQIEVKEHNAPHSTWQMLDDDLYKMMWNDIFEECKQDPKVGYGSLHPDRKSTFVWKAAQRARIHPFRDWLSTIPIAEEAPTWNPLDELWQCERPAGISEDDWDAYLFRVAWFPLVRAIGHAMNPAMENPRGCPVYVSLQQHIGKSTWLRNLLPPKAQRGLWFREQSIKQGPQALRDMVVGCAGAVFVEFSEGIGWSHSAREQTKSFLSSSAHTVDMKYRSAHRTFYHNWVDFFTSNDPSVLPNDPSGNSRFFPAYLQKDADWMKTNWDELDALCHKHFGEGHAGKYGKAVCAWIAENREMMWGCAKRIWEDHGAEWLQLPEHLSALREDVAESMSVKTDYDEALDDFLSDGGGVRHGGAGDVCAITKIDLARICGIAEIYDATARSERHPSINRQLKKHGFEPARIESEDQSKVRYETIEVPVLKRAVEDGGDPWLAVRRTVYKQTERCLDLGAGLRTEARSWSDFYAKNFAYTRPTSGF